MSIAVVFVTTVATVGCTSTIQRPSQTDVDLSRLEASVSIERPVEEVWSTVALRFDENARFEPATEHAFLLSEQANGLGAQRRSVGYDGREIDVEVTEWKPGSVVIWEIVRGGPPGIVAGRSGYRLEVLSPSRSRVTQIAEFKMANFIMQAVAKRKFPGLFTRNLTGLKHFLETGASASPNDIDALVERYSASLEPVRTP